MRFFSGMRTQEKKNSAAVEAYKKKLSSDKGGMPEQKKTPAEKFQEMLDERMMKIMKDYSEGKKKSSIALPGVKNDDSDEPKKVSPNAKKMFEVLAKQKLMNDMKKQRKKENEYHREQKKKQNAEALLKAKTAYDLELREKELLYQQEQANLPSASSHFWGTGE